MPAFLWNFCFNQKLGVQAKFQLCWLRGSFQACENMHDEPMMKHTDHMLFYAANI